MRTFFSSRRRRRPPAADPTRVVDLQAWNNGEGPVTTIARPDSLSPMDHTLPAIDPRIADARLTVTQVIADLAARGALDAGTFDVLDDWIDRQKHEWLTIVEAQTLDRRKTMERLLAQHVENFVHDAAILVDLRTRTRDAELTFAHWRDQVNGHPATATPPTGTPTGEPVVPSTPSLPRGHLSHLLTQGRP